MAALAIQSVDRCLGILDHVSRSEVGLTLSELAKAMGLKPTTVHNLAGSLAARGYLAKRRGPVRYVVGPAIEALAARQAERQFRGRAAEAMRTLARRLPWASVVFVEPQQDEPVTTLRIQPARPDVLEQPTRQAMSLYASASGLVFQAWWPDDVRAAAMQRSPFDDYGSATWRTLDQLQQHLDQVRRQGYAHPPDTSTGLIRVAAPVFTPPPRNELVAAIGAAAMVTDPSHRDRTAQAMIEHVTATAREWSTSETELP
jgi:IclR family acetate operon transcriptional repressor